MSLNIQTEVNLDMTVRITGRDQVTGEFIGKLNALFETVESLGGTINYPNPTTPVTPDFINCTYDGDVLSYTGGTVDIGDMTVAGLVGAMDFPVGATARFRLSKTSHEQMLLSFGTANAQVQNDRNNALTISSVSPSALTLQISKHGNDLEPVRLDEIDAYKITAHRATATSVLLNFYDSADELLGTREVMDVEANRFWLGVTLASEQSVFTSEIFISTPAES